MPPVFAESVTRPPIVALHYQYDEQSLGEDTQLSQIASNLSHLAETSQLDVQLPHLEETHPLETHPLETHPLETHPLETHPLETHPLETRPLETHPLETHPLETHPLQVQLSQYAETHPLETHPLQVQLSQYAETPPASIVQKYTDLSPLTSEVQLTPKTEASPNPDVPNPDVPTHTGSADAPRPSSASWSHRLRNLQCTRSIDCWRFLLPVAFACAETAHWIEHADVIVAAAAVAGLMWTTGALVLADCWIAHPPGISETLSVGISAAAGVVLNTVHPRVMRDTRSQSRSALAIMLLITYSCMFLHLAQVAWWSVDSRARFQDYESPHQCVDATGYYAVFLVSSATLLRFGAMHVHPQPATRSVGFYPDCFVVCAPVAAAVCVVGAILCHALATLGVLGQSASVTGVMPLVVLLPMCMLLESHNAQDSDADTPSHTWAVFISTAAWPWGILWPAVLFHRDLIDSLQAWLVCGGNLALLSAVRLVTEMIARGLASGTGYHGIGHMQFQF